MNPELFEKTAASQLTRRKIVTTGAKLGYAAPLVAASFKLKSLNALGVDTCDDLSPKPVGDGTFLTCKTDASGYGCDVREPAFNSDGDDEEPPKGSAQVLVSDNGAVCVCQSTTCTIDQPNGIDAVFTKGQTVTVCQPVLLPDFCNGGGGVSPV